MLRGLHYPNSNDTVEALRVAGAMRAESVKLLHTEGTVHTLQDLLALQEIGVRHFLVRLRDSLYRLSDGSTYIPRDTVYANDLVRDILLWYGRGVREFSICNEPNWLHTGALFGPVQYAWYMKRVVLLVREGLRAAGATGVILVSPPLSWSSALWHRDPAGTPEDRRVNKTEWTLNEWTDAFSAADPQAPDPNDRIPFWLFWDCIGATVYWQHRGDVRNPSYGASWFELYGRAAFKRIVALEVGQTANRLTDEHGNPRFSADQIRAQRAIEYRDWMYWTGGANIVGGAYFWIAPRSTDEFRGEEIDVLLAREMAKGGRDSLRMGAGRGAI